MEWQMWFTIASVVMMFVLLAKSNVGPEWICMATMTLLVGVGILDPKEAAAGLSNRGMLAVAILFIVAASIQSTGAIKLITILLPKRGKSLPISQFRMMAPVTFLSAFLNNTPVVAIFIPAISAWAKRIKIPVSKLMIPLSYAAVLGGTCTLIGTSTNLVVSGIFTKETGIQIGFFEIAKVGVPSVIVMYVSIFILSRWLLPNRSSAIEQMGDPKSYTIEMMVNPSSGLDGKTIAQAEFTEEFNINLIEIIRDGRSILSLDEGKRIRNGDRLVFSGGSDMVAELQQTKGLTPVMDRMFNISTPRPDRCMVEAVISPTNQLIGRSIVGGHFRQLYNAVIVGISRAGSQIKGTIGDIVLQSGDTLLLETHPSFYERQRNSRDFYLISQMEEETTEPRFNKAMLAIAILIGMVSAAAVFKINMFEASLIAAAILLITRCITPVQALKSIDTQVLLVIIAAFGIGKAMETTGAAEFIAAFMVGLAKDNPWLVLSALYLTTSILTEMVTNNAAALILFPIAMATAQKMGVSVTPFIFAIMLGASASFATPIGYQCNMMVYGPGGYKFSDFLKIGVPMNLIMWVAASILIPIMWPF